MKSLAEYVALLQNNNVAAWLRVLRQGESNQNEDAFTELYGGSHFESFDDHPRKHFPLPDGQNTSASGAYQITETTWNDFTAHLGGMPFSPENQGACAVWLTERAGALDDVLAGRLNAAIQRCAKVWTSLAIAKRQAEAPSIFTAYGGTLEPTATTTPPEVTPIVAPPPPAKAKSMGVLAAFLPSILQMLPQLVSVFGSPNDSEVAKRNQAAGVLVTNALVDATKAVNLQDAVDKMQSDPAALSAAHDAINELLPQLSDVGGGIDAARKFGADHENGRYGRILEVVSYSALIFLFLANCMSFAIGWFKGDWGRMEAVNQADIGVALMVFGYFLGSSISSKRKDETRGAQ